jgi:hypothetical protein
MGMTTFTGPITAGNILDTTGTTVGTDIANVGYVVMSQSATVNQATNVAVAGVYKTNIVIPAGSQILSVSVFKTTAWSGVAQTINVGTNTTATQLAVAADNNLSTTLGVTSIIPGDDATRTGNWIDVGTSDVQIYTKSTNTGTGVGTIVVTYAQARDLTA